MDYLDFELEIGVGTGREYPVAVIRSAGGEAREIMRFPFDELALESQLKDLQIALLRSGGTRRSVLLPEERTVRDFGSALFNALFTGDIRAQYAVMQDQARAQERGVRLKLRIQDPKLAVLPWEFLYDTRIGSYICLSSHTPLVRYPEVAQAPQVLSVKAPLSILAMTASPRDWKDLDLQRERERLEQALKPVQDKGQVQLTWLEGHSWFDLQKAMRHGPWHIFHFVGHGGYSEVAQEGLIVLENEAGKVYRLYATRLSQLLTDHHSLRLVILNSCEGAKGNELDVFSSTAATLVRNGIPAVLAMQYEITDKAALAFSRAFYDALADGLPVDTAVGEARKAINLEVENTLEWGTPVLYMRSPNGILFDLIQRPPLTQIQIVQSTSENATKGTSKTDEKSWTMTSLLESSIVRICTEDGDIVGAGFLVGAKQILTCAHVIARALGLPDNTPEMPQTSVHLDFPRVAPGYLLTARSIFWRPLQANGGDIAGIELDGDPPSGVQVARLARVDDLWERPFRAFGFPKGKEIGVWAAGRLLGRQGSNWVQIENGKEASFPVEPGFSGTPVWDTQLEAVVGMVVAPEQRIAAKTAFALPIDVLVSTWPLIESRIQPFVFLCYARADSELVMRLRADLGAQGINTWIDREGLEPGTPDWEASLRTTIRAAQAVLLIASPNARNSRYVRDELRLAEMYQRPLYPIWIEGIPVGWGGAQYIDAREGHYETALHEIVAALKGISSAPSTYGTSFKEPERDSEPRNPYKGLRAFSNEDAQDFFGREILIKALVESLKESLTKDVRGVESARLLTVIGASGSGKSSVVMAGLLPCLQEGELLGSREWVYLMPILPGMHPMESLALALAEQLPDRSLKAIREDLEDDSARGLHLLVSHIVKNSGRKVVLFIDQFEELFTLTTSENERQHFIDLLLTATTEPRGPVIAILTLRADFYDRPMSYPALYQLVEAHQQSVLLLEMADLRAVIEQPAALPDVQLAFEGSLVGDLLFEMQGQIGALPLLQFTLDQLFERRKDHLLTLAAYREIGGVRGALARQAESTYTELPSEDHRKLARALFLRLIDPGVTEQDTTRRRAALSELSLSDSVQTMIIKEAAEAFVVARLLTTNEIAGTTTIEVSHEALIREWTRLSGWLREAREDIALQQTISEDAADWVRHGRASDRLYRGTQLAEARAWAERNVPSRDEVVFLQASATEHQHQQAVEQGQKMRELTLQRRVVSRQRLLVAAPSIFSVVVIVLALVAEVGRLQADALRQQAETQARIASSRALAAQANYALVQSKPDRALLLSVKANQTYDTYDARDSLLTALEYSPRLVKILQQGTSGSNLLYSSTLTFSSDGQTLASFTQSDRSSWNIKTGKLSSSPFTFNLNSDRFPINNFLISPDNQILAATSNTGLWVKNIKLGTSIVHLLGDTEGIPPLPPSSFGFPVIAFSRDGKTLASSRCVQYNAQTGECQQGRILLWDVNSEKPTSQVLISQTGIAISMAFSPDGKTLASSNLDGTVQLWNIASKSLSGQFSLGHPQDFFNIQRIENIVFSPDGKLLASGSSDGIITIWDAVSQKRIGEPLVGHAGAVTELAFSRDGTILASGSDDKTIRLWNIEMYPTPFTSVNQPLRGHIGSISSLTFSPDSRLLASSDSSGTIIVWNMAADSSIKQKLEYPSDVHSMVFSREGNVIVAGDDKGNITLREVKTGNLLYTLDATMNPMSIPNSQSYDDGPLTIESLALSMDGHILAAGRRDGMIFLWDMGTRKLITHFRSETRLRSIVFNPDGHLLASSHDSGTLLIWAVATGKTLHQLTHHTSTSYINMSDMAFSQDGKILASGDAKSVIFWDVSSGSSLGRPLVGHTADVQSVAFSPDKKTLASIDLNSSVILWDIATRKPIGQPLLNFDQDLGRQGHFNRGFAFSPDGTMLASGGYTTVTLWDVTRRDPVAHAFQEDKDAFGQSVWVSGITFNPNSQQLAVIFTQFNPSHITLWDISRKSWQVLACSIANRNLTIGEWKQFVGDEPYQKVCPNLPIDQSVITDILDQAHAAALTGHKQDAIIAYTQAVQWAMENADAGESNSVCRRGSLDQLAQVVMPACENAVKLEPNNPNYLDSRGLARVSTGDTRGATADFNQAAQLALESGDANASNDVCWDGSLAQFAMVVLPACEYAVKFDPTNVDYHDSRGLARALLRDTKGAIADFQFVVQSANANNGWTPEKVKERTLWLHELETGRNPFDTKTLKVLQQE